VSVSAYRGENVTRTRRWEIPYSHSAGPVASRFLVAIRDEQQIQGTRCSSCDRVMVPPRGHCVRCFVETDDWVAVGASGTIEAFTITYAAFPGAPEPPYALAYVRLDGADTAMANFVEGLDLSDPAAASRQLTGARVDLAFRDERVGAITDFYFTLSSTRSGS
jgi:uncharacterized OB-fold protein